MSSRTGSARYNIHAKNPMYRPSPARCGRPSLGHPRLSCVSSLLKPCAAPPRALRALGTLLTLGSSKFLRKGQINREKTAIGRRYHTLLEIVPAGKTVCQYEPIRRSHAMNYSHNLVVVVCQERDSGTLLAGTSSTTYSCMSELLFQTAEVRYVPIRCT